MSSSHASAISPGIVVAERYRIVKALAEGGVGSVWVAEHVGLGRRVALKVLHADVARDPRALERFDREARTLAKLTHPNIVAPIDYGTWNGAPYLVMELLEGKPLSELLGIGRTLDVEPALAIARPLLQALAHAHAHGIVHRDLKPANVFLQSIPDEGDHLKLIDFGLAKPHAPQSDAGITGKNVAVGTPPYMPPESLTGATLDARADVYSAGVMLFEMLTGRRPFEGEPVDVLRRKMSGEALRARAARPDGTIPEWLDEAIAKAIARKPDERFQTVSEFARALVPPKEPRRPVASTRGPWIPWVVAAIAVLAALYLGVRGI
ncbi:MAG: serine/threonine-protein kinase [Sandaracinus sp.]